jgi:2-methylisocitrate lyase-like PEP mutase family enzyme
MFRTITLVLLWTIAVSVSADQVKPTGQAPTNAELRQQYAANLAKAAKEQEASHKRNVKIIARTEALLKRHEEMMKQTEEMLKRQQNDVARFEKILGTWERQQVQYQKYLDSLSKK